MNSHSHPDPSIRYDCVGPVVVALHPKFRSQNDLLGIGIQPGPPPAKGAIGNDMVLTLTHQAQVLVALILCVLVKQRHGIGPFHIVTSHRGKSRRATEGFPGQTRILPFPGHVWRSMSRACAATPVAVASRMSLWGRSAEPPPPPRRSSHACR